MLLERVLIKIKVEERIYCHFKGKINGNSLFKQSLISTRCFITKNIHVRIFTEYIKILNKLK